MEDHDFIGGDQTEMKIEKYEDFENIWRVNGFDKEYEALFGKSKKEYRRCVETLFRNLELLDKNQTDGRSQFEKIEDNLFSIRDVSTLNPRVLYTGVLNDGRIVLLHPFLEKSKKDYEQGKRRAREQIKELNRRNFYE